VGLDPNVLWGPSLKSRAADLASRLGRGSAQPRIGRSGLAFPLAGIALAD